jgi:hypothetical protein
VSERPTQPGDPENPCFGEDEVGEGEPAIGEEVVCLLLLLDEELAHIGVGRPGLRTARLRFFDVRWVTIRNVETSTNTTILTRFLSLCRVPQAAQDARKLDTFESAAGSARTLLDGRSPELPIREPLGA